MAGSAYADQEEGGLITDINVTPLVDIVLVLLIVFMITMPTIVAMDAMQEGELDISLPTADQAQPLTAKKTELVVNVDANGKFIVGHVTHTEAELMHLMEEAQSKTPGHTTVTVRADKRCPWQYLATVINLCHKTRIKDYFFSTVEQ
jgi:biopolymer transport protein ExbD